MEEDLTGHGGVVKKIVHEGKGEFPSRGSLVSGILLLLSLIVSDVRGDRDGDSELCRAPQINRGCFRRESWVPIQVHYWQR